MLIKLQHTVHLLKKYNYLCVYFRFRTARNLPASAVFDLAVQQINSLYSSLKNYTEARLDYHVVRFTAGLD